MILMNILTELTPEIIEKYAGIVASLLSQLAVVITAILTMRSSKKTNKKEIGDSAKTLGVMSNEQHKVMATSQISQLRGQIEDKELQLTNPLISEDIKIIIRDRIADLKFQVEELLKTLGLDTEE
jgi:hypothetical protein